jgi:hypothetical protein
MIGAMIFAKHAKPSIGLFKAFLNSPPLLDDHQTEQTRVANPLLNWVRDVTLLVEKNLKLQEWLRSSEFFSKHEKLLS